MLKKMVLVTPALADKKINRVVRQPSGFEQLPLENVISQPEGREITGLERQPTGLSNKFIVPAILHHAEGE